MKKQFVFGIAGMVVLACLVVLVSNPSLHSQDEPKANVGKNMKVFVGDKAFETQKDLQLFMKSLTEALGVQCSYCHDMRDFTKDVPELHKDKAREMMSMTHEINDKYFKDHPEEQMTCYACHRGREMPVFSKKAWMDIQAKEANN